MGYKTPIVVDKLPTNSQLEDARQSVKSAISQLGDGMISMSNDDRKSSRSISEGREGYVDEVLRVANEYEDILPRNIDLNLVRVLFNYFKSLKQLLVLVEKLGETVDDTTLGIGVELMHHVDIILKNLQVAREYNANLDRALAGIDNYNSRFGKRSDNGSSADVSIDTVPVVE